MLYREYPICSNKITNVLFEQKFAKIKNITFLEGYKVASCNNCGFIYANNIPSQLDFDESYRSS